MTYLERLRMLLNQITDTKHNIWNRSYLEQKDKERLSFEYDLEITKIQLLIIKEQNRCLADITIEK